MRVKADGGRMGVYRHIATTQNGKTCGRYGLEGV